MPLPFHFHSAFGPESKKQSEIWAMRSSKGPSPRVAEADLKCKNDECEFYGNAQWEGYCSKCRKIFTRAAKSESRVRHSDSSSSHERCVVCIRRDMQLHTLVI